MTHRRWLAPLLLSATLLGLMFEALANRRFIASAALMPDPRPHAILLITRLRYRYAREHRPALPDTLATSGHAEMLPTPGDILPSLVPQWSWQPSQLPQLSPQRRELWVFSQPQCPLCKHLQQRLGQGDAELFLRWLEPPHPSWVQATPTWYDPQRHVYFTGATELVHLRRWLNLPPAGSIAADAIPVGSVRHTFGLQGVLQHLPQVLGPRNQLRLERGGAIPLGTGSISLPTPCVLDWQTDGQTLALRLREGAAELRHAWGSWPCTGVSYTDGRLTFELPWLPDLQVRVER